MKKNIEEMKQKNGCFEIAGKQYILLDQANFQCDPISGFGDWEFDEYYYAHAICPDDETDEDGYQKCYKIRWEILESYEPEYMGEDLACDWDKPSSITVECEYNLEIDCYY